MDVAKKSVSQVKRIVNQDFGFNY